MAALTCSFNPSLEVTSNAGGATLALGRGERFDSRNSGDKSAS